MKIKVFHQFVYLERGPKNTAIIDCLTGNVYHAENRHLDKFGNRQYREIEELIQSLEAEKLIITVEEGSWVPRKQIGNEITEDIPITIELDEGLEPNWVLSKFKGLEISSIIIYGTEKSGLDIPGPAVSHRNKNFQDCHKFSKIDGDFGKISEAFYRFNKTYNSCRGGKIAITNDRKVRPCIYSDQVIGDITVDKLDQILSKVKSYWVLNKDKIKKCKDCEFRYVCFDCREIARRHGGELQSPNPLCGYDPQTGTWA